MFHTPVSAEPLEGKVTVPQTRWQEVRARRRAGEGQGVVLDSHSEVDGSKEETMWWEGEEDRQPGPASGPTGLAGVGRWDDGRGAQSRASPAPPGFFT